MTPTAFPPSSLESLAKTRHLPAQFLSDLGVEPLPSGGVRMPYFDQKCRPVFARTRDVPGRPRFDQPAGVKLMAYGVWKLVEAQRQGRLILVEGESDCWTLWHQGYPALGVPGAASYGVLERGHLDGVGTLYVVREPGQGGDTFVTGVHALLARWHFAGRALEVRLPDGIKDPSDLHKLNPSRFKEMFDQLLAVAGALSPAPARRQTQAAAEEEKAEPVLVQLSKVEAERTRWMWRFASRRDGKTQYWIPEGALSLLDGDPGMGKSTLTLDLAARVTRGWSMPPLDGPDVGTAPAGVLLLGAEDSLRHTVRPRLDAAGADVSKVYSLEAIKVGKDERPPVLPWDLELVAGRIREHGIRLVVADPLMAFLGSEFDAHKDQDIRRCLRPLSKLADELGVVILLLRHLNKLSGGAALYRGGGSIGIPGASRAALIVGRDPADPDTYVLAMNKPNLGPFPRSLAYRLETANHDKVGPILKIKWVGETDLQPADILWHATSAGRGPGRPDDSLDEARQFLVDLLAGGPVLVKDIKEAAESAVVSWGTLKRAKQEMNIETVSEGRDYSWRFSTAQTASSGN
jgi:archaellum biogenesis ATPase FlaH